MYHKVWRHNISVLFIDLETNSKYYPVYDGILTDCFYDRDGVCLLCGMNWILDMI